MDIRSHDRTAASLRVIPRAQNHPQLHQGGTRVADQLHKNPPRNEILPIRSAAAPIARLCPPPHFFLAHPATALFRRRRPAETSRDGRQGSLADYSTMAPSPRRNVKRLRLSPIRPEKAESGKAASQVPSFLQGCRISHFIDLLPSERNG